MSRFLNTRGRSVLTIGLCDRCRRKFPIGELMSDPNAPGLKVCAADRDELDPYTLPPRMPEEIAPRFVRKDVDISLTGNEPGIIPGGGGQPGHPLLDDAGQPFVLDESRLS